MARVKSYWRTRMLLLGVGVAAALPIAGIAYASIPDSNGVIHGCYLDAGRGTLRVIDTEAGEACGNSEVAIEWNQTGPQRPQGPQGHRDRRGRKARKDLRVLRVPWAMKVRESRSRSWFLRPIHRLGTSRCPQGVSSCQHPCPSMTRAAPTSSCSVLSWGGTRQR
jgi:hypothetical protein